MERKTAIHLTRQALRFVKATKVSQQDIDKIAQLTDRNYHTEARIYIAEKILKEKKLTEAFKATATLHSYFGHMLAPVGQVQNELEKALKAFLGAKLSAEDAAKVWESL